MTDFREDTPLRRAIVTAWALHEGYTVTAASWYDKEGVEAWEWDDPDGREVGGEFGDHSDLPSMPDELFERLNRECHWRGV